MTRTRPDLKDQVRDFWNEESCGEVYARGTDVAARLAEHSRARYELEPYISEFANFDRAYGKDLLEVGVGMGADHLQWARQRPRSLTGVDLTPRALEWTAERLRLDGLSSKLALADAENLPFADNSFDLVYSWGVIHHTPDTGRAISEIHRVLRPGGEARVMIYHARSLVGYLLWVRYALFAAAPGRSMREIYASHLESPGTKAYTIPEARGLISCFRRSEVWSLLTFGDLLLGEVGQRHSGGGLAVVKAVWPRRLIRRTLHNYGLALLIRATK